MITYPPADVCSYRNPGCTDPCSSEQASQTKWYKYLTHFDTLSPQSVVLKNDHQLSLSDGPTLAYSVSFKDRGQWAGVMSLEYDTASIADLIDPLYEEAGDFELIIYSTWYDQQINGEPLDYKRPIYSSGSQDMQITEEIFNELIDNIYVEQVFEYFIDGLLYHSYSQAVPPDTTDPADIKFYLFFMILAEQAYANSSITEIESMQTSTYLIVLAIVGICCLCVLSLILLIARRTSNKICNTI